MGEPVPDGLMTFQRMGRETSATYMRPFHLETLANHFPRLKIVGAHFGGTGVATTPLLSGARGPFTAKLGFAAIALGDAARPVVSVVPTYRSS